MRKMGIDYGTRRVGIALTDESGQMAFPHSVIPNDTELTRTIATLITSEGVEQVVVGASKNKDGSDNPLQEAITEFITDLTLEVGVPIDTIDERYTTQHATREQGRNEMTDASAAALILDAYISST